MYCFLSKYFQWLQLWIQSTDAFFLFLSSFLGVHPTDLEDMSRMILRTKGPERLPPGYEMVLYIPISDSDKVGVFYLQSKWLLSLSSLTLPHSLILTNDIPNLGCPTLLSSFCSPCADICWGSGSRTSPAAATARSSAGTLMLVLSWNPFSKDWNWEKSSGSAWIKLKKMCPKPF